MSGVPVLLVAFKRPSTTRKVMESVRSARPPRLYFAVDGPRPEVAGEAQLCEACRSLASEVDWPCEVFTLFRDKNRGCRLGVSEAITWFFDHEPEGIILEDDCVPHPDFYRFAEELLDRYRDDPRIMAITGDNFQTSMGNLAESYYFSIFNHVWGWASWRRAWSLYDTELTTFTPKRAREIIGPIEPIPGFSDYWTGQLQRTKARRIDTWDYVWTWSCWQAGGLTCTPRANMVKNIGFGEDATHTFAVLANDGFPVLDAQGLHFPLVHPAHVRSDSRFDRVAAIRWGLTTGATPDMKLSRRILKPIKRQLKIVKRKLGKMLTPNDMFRFRQGWHKTTRTAILRHLAASVDAKFCLEIGGLQASAFRGVPSSFRVDPNPGMEATHTMSSDAFFESHSNLKFDLISIDGSRPGAEVTKDIENALSALNEGGYLLLHDLLPRSVLPEYEKDKIHEAPDDWQDTSWYSFIKYRAERDDLEMFAVDCAPGFGVIRKGRQTPYRGAYGVYSDLISDRAQMLNLISVDEFLQRV